MDQEGKQMRFVHFKEDESQFVLNPEAEQAFKSTMQQL
jgi:hypothetical protein